MSSFTDLARHPFAAIASFGRAGRHDAARDVREESGRALREGTTGAIRGDPYGPRRAQRMAELEAAGTCLARSGKHGNLRYWPAERGSRVLSEHRRSRRLHSATPLA